jgi:hypothetical protein
MGLATLRRWHWMALGAIAGLIVGLVRSASDGPLYGLNIQGYGVLLSDQQQFENALVQDYNGIRLFSDPVVYPHRDSDAVGRRKLVYIVTGRYWDGRPRVRGSESVAEWLPRCVITQTPYRPRIGIAGAGGATISEFPSVLEFLAALNQQYGVQYRYAWWAAYPVTSWVFACLIVVGGIWPTVVNLMAFGTPGRPPHVKPLSLWNVRAPKKPAQKPAVDELTVPGDSTGEIDIGQESRVASEPPSTAVKTLVGTALEMTPAAPEESKEFGAKDDDYYPTERHVAGARTPS